MNDDTKLGYFTSNRDGGAGSDDIYQLKEIKPLVVDCTQEVTGVVKNKKTGDIIPNAIVTIYDEASTVIHTLKSNANGSFTFDVDCKKGMNLRVIGEKERFIQDEETVKVVPKVVSSLALNLELEPKAAEVGTDLFKLLNLNPIYFDYDKSFIRPDAQIELAKIINYMKEFPNVKVDVRSHTDSRGRDAYNLALSQRRNTSTINYIVDKGISRSRITGKGYGETQLSNKCKNGVKCTKEEHQLNRRSEFIVTEN